MMLTPGTQLFIAAFSSLRGKNDQDHFDNLEFRNALRDICATKWYVRDPENNWFRDLSGIETLSDMSGRSLMAIFMGHSMGGYGAIYIGCKLHVDAVLAFAPQTKEDKKWRGFLPHDDFIETVEGAELTTIYIVYAKQSADKEHAEHLARLPNVVLLPKEGGSHNVAREAVKNGDLVDMIWRIQNHTSLL